MVAKVEELNNIGPSHRSASLTLVLENGEPRDGEADGRFEFVCLEAPSEQSINLLSHGLNFTCLVVLTSMI